MKFIKLIFILLLLSSCSNAKYNQCPALLTSEVGKKPINSQIEFANKKYCKFCRDFDSRYTKNCDNYSTFLANL